MFGKKCSLCGGNLVNGKCQECGLDNTRKRMYQVNEWECDGQPLTHEHTQETSYGGVNNDDFFNQRREEQEEFERRSVLTNSMEEEENKRRERKMAQQRSARPQQPPYRQPQSHPSQNRPPYGQASEGQPPRKKRSVLGTIIWIFILIQILSAVFTGLAAGFSGIFDMGYEDSASPDYTFSEEELVAEEFEWADYAEAAYELSTEGEDAELLLESGLYVVGVHIPEGIYTLECIECGIIDMDDDVNNAWAYNYFNEENEGMIYEDVYMYNGTIIQVDGGSYEIVSDCANYDDMEYMENPNTETYTLTTEAIIGVEVPAGVYDVSISEGDWGILQIYIAEDGEIDEDSLSTFYKFMCNDGDEGEIATYKNVVLTENSVVVLETEYSSLVSVTLTPSEVIIDEDYEGFYEGRYIYY